MFLTDEQTEVLHSLTQCGLEYDKAEYFVTHSSVREFFIIFNEVNFLKKIEHSLKDIKTPTEHPDYSHHQKKINALYQHWYYSRHQLPFTMLHSDFYETFDINGRTVETGIQPKAHHKMSSSLDDSDCVSF